MSGNLDLKNKQIVQGVQFEYLEKVCEIANAERKSLNPDSKIAGKIPYFGANGIKDYVRGYTHDGNFILLARVGSGSIENYSVQYTEGKFWANENVHVIRGKKGLNNRFLFHYLSNLDFRPHLAGVMSAMLTKEKLLKIPIPIPDPELQEKIVNLLDRFNETVSAMEKELVNELKNRQEQFSYYLNNLFSFDDIKEKGNCKNNFVKWCSLGEVGKFVRGDYVKEHDLTNSGTGCIQSRQIIENNSTYTNQTKTFISKSRAKKFKKAKKGDLVIATAVKKGEDGCKAIAWLGDDEVVVSNHAYIYQHSLVPKYIVYYFMADQFKKQLKTIYTGTFMSYIDSESMSKITIPVPTIEEQHRIANTLEKFDVLISDITQRIQTEIASRRIQNDYYRNQLLTF